MPVWNDPHVGGDETFLTYTVSAATVFGETEMLYVDKKGKGRLVSCVETGAAKVGDRRPCHSDADGVPPPKVTAEEILLYMRKRRETSRKCRRTSRCP